MSNATRKVIRNNNNGERIEKPEVTDVVDGVEFWRLQAQGNALESRRQEARAAQAEVRQLEKEHADAVQAMHAKYGLTDGDSINPETFAITRAVRNPPPAEEPPDVIGDAMSLVEKQASK